MPAVYSAQRATGSAVYAAQLASGTIHDVTIANSQQANTASAASIPQATTHYLSFADSQQANTVVSVAVPQTHVVSAGNSQQINQASPVAVLVSGFSGSLSDADIARIASAVLAALQATTIPVNVTQVNHVTLQGSGIPADPMRPA